MASIRFPNKILLNLHGLPMVEHVRRRALLSEILDKVYVASSDQIILNKLKQYKANIIKTKKKHLNGTSRVGEAILRTNCTHVILLQGDEPLLLPKYINKIYDSIIKYPDIDAWNLRLERKGIKLITFCLKTGSNISWKTVFTIFFITKNITFIPKIIWRFLKFFITKFLKLKKNK